jgi:Ser/Thr protein kinase RdoA (MazF antagonist)
MTTTDQAFAAPAAAGLRTFDHLTKGDPAPAWLRDGIAAAWAFGAGDPTVTLITVSENATFLVRVAGVPVAVTRVARPGYVAGATEFESELAWVAALGETGTVRVPSALRTHDGRFVASVHDGTGTTWSCVSFSYLDGDILEDVAEPVPYYREIGRTTAVLHEHVTSWRPPAGFRRHTWDVEHMVGPGCRWGRWENAGLAPDERTLLDAAQSAALTVLADAPRTPASSGLIHADLRPSNLMVDDAGRLTVIDFDDCGHSWFWYDFASALTFMEHTDEAPAMASEWVAGYTEIRPMTSTDVDVACALSMVRRLQMLGWTTTHREDALPPTLWVAQAAGTLDVAEAYLRRARWLLS